MSNFKTYCEKHSVLCSLDDDVHVCTACEMVYTNEIEPLQSKITELEAKLFVCDYPLRYILSHEGLSEDIIHCISEALEKIKGTK